MRCEMPPSLADSVISTAQSILPRFSNAVLPLPYEANGILLSEGLAFCAACDLCEIDLIIESQEVAPQKFGLSTPTGPF